MKNKGWLSIENNITKCGTTKPLRKQRLFNVFYFSQQP